MNWRELMGCAEAVASDLETLAQYPQYPQKPFPPPHFTHFTDITDGAASHDDETNDGVAPRKFAILTRLPDGRRFWIAPDGAEFDPGGLLVVRTNYLEAWHRRGRDPDELRQTVDAALLVGGEVREP